MHYYESRNSNIFQEKQFLGIITNSPCCLQDARGFTITGTTGFAANIYSTHKDFSDKGWIHWKYIWIMYN